MANNRGMIDQRYCFSCPDCGYPMKLRPDWDDFMCFNPRCMLKLESYTIHRRKDIFYISPNLAYNGKQ